MRRMGTLLHRFALNGGVALPRLALAVIVAATAFAAAGLAGNSDGGHHYPEALETTLCYGCHKVWSPPLKAMATLAPSKVVVGAAELVVYTLRVQNSWQAALVGINPCLDISQAPGLRFVGGHQPIKDNATELSLTYNPGRLQNAQAVNMTYSIPPGASRLAFRAVPHDASAATGPDIILRIVPPTAPEILVNQAGPGGSENATFSAQDLKKYPPGNWTVGFQVPPAVVSGQPAPPRLPGSTRIDVKMVEDAEFDTDQLTTLCTPRTTNVPKTSSTLVSWSFVVKEVVPGALTATVNTTAYYEHATNAPNFGNVTQSVSIPATVVGDKLQIGPDEVTLEPPSLINGPTLVTISEAVGYAGAFLIVSSIVSGGMLGRASRQWLSKLFGSAKRRVAFHNFLSYGIVLASFVHMGIFLFRITGEFAWTLGVIWGGLAILAMFGLGFTGALQVPMIRRWNYGTWRWSHYGLTIAVIVFTLVHMLLDGQHFGDVQTFLHWTDPLNKKAIGTGS